VLKDALRAAAGHADRLVRGEQHYIVLLQLPFNRQALERPSSDPAYALANHDIEATVRVCGLLKQVGDATVSRKRNAELLMNVGAAPAIDQLLTARLDISEVRDDHP
jgi:hypothetical protein